MAHVVEDRVRDTTTTTGSGAVTLAGSAPTGFVTFGSVCADGDTVNYCIAHQSANEWEVGYGTYSTTGPTLTRTAVLNSSNAGAAVTFSAGTKDVFLTAAADGIPFFARPIGTLTGLPWFDLPNGYRDCIVPPAGWCHYGWRGAPGIASPHNMGIIPTVTGTATAVASGGTAGNPYSRSGKNEALVTAASTTAVAGWRSTTATPAQLSSGSTAVCAGFLAVQRWGPATGVTTATRRAFCGWAAVLTAPTDAQPSNQVSCIGMGYDAADTNMQIMHNDSAGTCTKVDLGFARPSANRTSYYELVLYAPGRTASLVYWMVTDLSNGNVYTGTITTDLPAASTVLAPRVWASVGGTSSVIGVATGPLDLWTPA